MVLELKRFVNILRLQLVIVVAFNAIQIAGLVVDRLKGSHTAAREGVCEKVVAQNGPWRTLRSIRGTFWWAKGRGKKEEKEHFEPLRCLRLLHQD